MGTTAQTDQKFLFLVTSLFSVVMVFVFLFYGILSFAKPVSADVNEISQKQISYR